MCTPAFNRDVCPLLFASRFNCKPLCTKHELILDVGTLFDDSDPVTLRSTLGIQGFQYSEPTQKSYLL